jgi:cytochrome c oxidase subunit IV
MFIIIIIVDCFASPLFRWTLILFITVISPSLFLPAFISFAVTQAAVIYLIG